MKRNVHRVSAHDYMAVMNNFIGGERLRIGEATKRLGVSQGTFRTWGTIYFEVGGDLRKCPFIDQETIEAYEQGKLPPAKFQKVTTPKSALKKNLPTIHKVRS